MRESVFFPLLLLFVSSVLAQLYVLDNIDAVINQTYNIGLGSLLSSLGLPSDFLGMQFGSLTLGFNLASGALMLAISGLSIAVLAGAKFKVLDSGFELSETSVSALTYGLTYFGAWMLLSVLGSPLFFAIPLIGLPFYFLLSLIYVNGVLEMMHINA